MDYLKCNWFDEESLFKENWHGYDTFSFSINKPIYLIGLGIHGRTPNSGLKIKNPERFFLTLRNQTDYLLANTQVVIHHDGSKKVYEVFYEKPVLLEIKTAYHLRIARTCQNDLENFVGSRMVDECFVDDIKFEKENYFKENSIISCILFKKK